MPPRYVIQLTTGSETSEADINVTYRILVALCNDGTMWKKRISTDAEAWTQIENVPQPE